MDEILAKKQAFYDKVKNNFDFRMKQVDLKLIVMNGFSGDEGRYKRYKSTVYDTCLNIEYTIGKLGNLIENK